MSLKNILFVLLFALCTMPAALFGQSAFSKSAVSKSDPRFIEYTFEGRLQGTGTLTSSALDLTGIKGPVQLTYYFDASDDSVKGSISLLGSDHDGKTATLNALAVAETTETYKVVVDTVDARWLNNYYLYVNGSSGNGDSTYFYTKLKFPK
jgi:hypothetical protein